MEHAFYLESEEKAAEGEMKCTQEEFLERCQDIHKGVHILVCRAPIRSEPNMCPFMR